MIDREYGDFLQFMEGWDDNDADDRVMTQDYKPSAALNSLLSRWYQYFDMPYEPNRRYVRQSWNLSPEWYRSSALHLVSALSSDPNNNSSFYRPRIFELASEEVMKWLRESPRDIDRVHDRSFELIVAEVIKEKGWEVCVTKRTRDGGYDVIGTQNNVLGFPMKIIVECKRYDPKSKIGVAMVDRLMGVKVRVTADRAIFVTTSQFTKPVWETWENHVGRDLELVDREELLEWLKEYSGAT